MKFVRADLIPSKIQESLCTILIEKRDATYLHELRDRVGSISDEFVKLTGNESGRFRLQCREYQKLAWAGVGSPMQRAVPG